MFSSFLFFSEKEKKKKKKHFLSLQNLEMLFKIVPGSQVNYEHSTDPSGRWLLQKIQ